MNRSSESRSPSAIFKHSPLDLSQESIRLIKILPGSAEPIQCQLRHATLSEVDYIALSYQWGSSADAKQIELNSRQFCVTSNLHAFLLAARKKGATTSFWIDAVCIDQSNISERNEQVKRMSQIYSTAKEVWVWLGNIPLVSPLPVSQVFDLSQPAHVPDLSERARTKIQKWRSEGNEAWLVVLRSICSRGYWNRLWIVQEFLIANSLLILVGDDTVQGEEFSAFIVESTNPSYLYPPRPIREEIRAWSAWNLCRVRHGPIKVNGYQIPEELTLQGSEPLEMSLEQVLARYGQAECTDWHDKVYGLLALVRNGGSFPIDYSVGKIALLMAVLRFEEHENWPLTLAIADFFTFVLEIPDLELLQYGPNNQEDDQNAQWKTIPIRIRGVVDKPSGAKPRQWILSNRGTFKNDCKAVTIDMCGCPDCASVPLLLLQPGDEIYELESFIDSPRVDNHTYLAFRPNASTRSGREYLGALSARGFSTEFLLHSLPQLPCKYHMHKHLARDPADETLLLLEADPSTLCFLIHTLVGKSRETPLLNTPGNQRVYEWDHDLTFHFGPPSQQMGYKPPSLGELTFIVDNVVRSLKTGRRR